MSAAPKQALLELIVFILAGWINRRQQAVIDYLVEENRVLREQLGGRRLPLNDHQRRRLALRGKVLGRRKLDEVASIVTPETMVYWTVCRTFPVPVRGQAGAAGVVGGEAAVACWLAPQEYCLLLHSSPAAVEG